MISRRISNNNNNNNKLCYLAPFIEEMQLKVLHNIKITSSSSHKNSDRECKLDDNEDGKMLKVTHTEFVKTAY